jgi:DedD protein
MTSTHDDSFREIQLSGKQLVFLFMAVVVILVGTFLMGLQVGRGVLAAKGAPGTEVAATEAEPPPPPSSASPGTSTSPATAGEKLSYAERLGSAEPPKEQLKADATPAPPETPPTPREELPVPAPVAAKSAPPAAPVPNAAATASTSAALAEPTGAGFAIQLAALQEKGEADAIARRLAGKGYPAYVVTPAKGAPSVFRVRVGKFKERREADSVAARLQKEEQFKPWIVR